MFKGDGPLSPRAAALRRNVVRLADKAVWEYSAARAAVLAQIAEGNRTHEEMKQGRIIYTFGFTDHMENCLNAVRRVLSLLEHLRSEPTAPLQYRDTRRLIEAHARLIIGIRDTLEHLGERFQDEIRQGDPVILKFGDDEKSVQLGNCRLTFDSLVIVLRATHQVADLLLKPPSPTNGWPL